MYLDTSRFSQSQVGYLYNSVCARRLIIIMPHYYENEYCIASFVKTNFCESLKFLSEWNFHDFYVCELATQIVRLLIRWQRQKFFRHVFLRSTICSQKSQKFVSQKFLVNPPLPHICTCIVHTMYIYPHPCLQGFDFLLHCSLVLFSSHFQLLLKSSDLLIKWGDLILRLQGIRKCTHLLYNCTHTHTHTPFPAVVSFPPPWLSD